MKWCVTGLLCGLKYHRGSATALPAKLACSGTAGYQLGHGGLLSPSCHAPSSSYGSQTAEDMSAGYT
jgi:hypothetical protein